MDLAHFVGSEQPSCMMQITHRQPQGRGWWNKTKRSGTRPLIVFYSTSPTQGQGKFKSSVAWVGVGGSGIKKITPLPPIIIVGENSAGYLETARPWISSRISKTIYFWPAEHHPPHDMRTPHDVRTPLLLVPPESAHGSRIYVPE